MYNEPRQRKTNRDKIEAFAETEEPEKRKQSESIVEALQHSSLYIKNVQQNRPPTWNTVENNKMRLEFETQWQSLTLLADVQYRNEKGSLRNGIKRNVWIHIILEQIWSQKENQHL